MRCPRMPFGQTDESKILSSVIELIQRRHLTPLRGTDFENIERKGENACKQHLLIFPQCCITFQRPIKSFHQH